MVAYSFEYDSGGMLEILRMRVFLGGCSDLLKGFRGYPEEMQGFPEAVSRDSDNDYRNIPRMS